MTATLAHATARLATLGQSVWLDALRRDWIEDGQLARWVGDGVSGVTSNPAIFRAAFDGSTAYDAEIGLAARGGAVDAAEVYDRLTVADIQAACDVLRPVWEATEHRDGWVSHEVDPALAEDAEGTVAEAGRLWRAIDRPNAMIKIPATTASLPAIRRCLATGIPVNVTLVFSLCQYEAVADAYLLALEDRLAAGQPLAPVTSVVSLFVSRFDAALANRLGSESPARDDEVPRANPLDSAAADALAEATVLANARAVYQRFRALVDGPRFARLARHGARPQRLLFASTAVKQAGRPPLTFVAPLVGADTVTTLPPSTLGALAERTAWSDELAGATAADAHSFEALRARGIDPEAVGFALTVQGVAAFREAHQAAIGTLDTKLRAWAADHPGALSSI